LIPVHVRKGERESKCDVIYNGYGLNLGWKKVKSKKQLISVETKTAEEFIRKYHLGIVHKWNLVFVFNEKVSCEKINKL